MAARHARTQMATFSAVIAILTRARYYILLIRQAHRPTQSSCCCRSLALANGRAILPAQQAVVAANRHATLLLLKRHYMGELLVALVMVNNKAYHATCSLVLSTVREGPCASLVNLIYDDDLIIRFGSWSACSATCGSASQQRIYSVTQ